MRSDRYNRWFNHENGGLVKAEEPFMVIPGDDNLLELESMRDAAGITQNLYSALDAVVTISTCALLIAHRAPMFVS